MGDDIVILSKMNPTGTICCPYCHRGKTYSFGCKGQQSQPCDKCHNMVLWDYNEMKSYKARIREYVS